MSQRIRQMRAPSGSVDRRPRPSPLVPRPPAGVAAGFTLVELLIVMVIISLLLGFILNAAMDSVKRAQERATQALITKLEAGLNDRLDALMQNRPDPNQAHKYLAAVWYNGTVPIPNPFQSTNSNSPSAWPVTQRSQVIAWYDYIKSQLPDVFYVQNFSPSTQPGTYPLNFAGNPYPASGGNPIDNYNLGTYILPMGNSIAAMPLNYPPGDGNVFNVAGTGVFGASYTAAAGIYKNLGYLPQGYDGADNDSNGTIDDSKEGIGADPMVPSPENPQVQIPLSSLIQTRLGNHKHATARSEMLYAILVEGLGPLGSAFSADEFTDKEVKDTDGDGLPEFIDAWGNPLQFFRWPLLYHSDIQRGQPIIQTNGELAWSLYPAYQNPAIAQGSLLNMFQERELDPLDLNQQLVGPAWWSSSWNGLSGYSNPVVSGASGGVAAFEYYFHRLSDPYPQAGGAMFWDRGGTYPGRRAYYSKFLVVSGGLDGQLGVFLYPDSYIASMTQSSPASVAWALIANENNALPFSPTDPTTSTPIANFTSSATYSSTTITYNPSPDPTNPSSSDLIQAAGDDISNQNIQTTVAIGGGG